MCFERSLNCLTNFEMRVIGFVVILWYIKLGILKYLEIQNAKFLARKKNTLEFCFDYTGTAIIHFSTTIW